MRKCDIEISIAGAEKISLLDTYGFHLLESPARVVAPIREYDKQSFPESAAPEIDTRTVKQPFEYKVSLGCWDSETTVNSRIREFYASLFSAGSGDVMEAKEVEFFNNYKNVKMKGYAKEWDDKTYTLEGEKGLVVFDFVLDVNDPNTLTDIQ